MRFIPTGDTTNPYAWANVIWDGGSELKWKWKWKLFSNFSI